MRRVTTRMAGLGAAVAVGVLALPGVANAAVDRYPTSQTLTYQMTVAGTYVHDLTINQDPCGPTFTGTGTIENSGYADYTETLAGTLGGEFGPGQTVTFTSQYLKDGAATGYQYTVTAAFTDDEGDFAGTLSDSNGQTALPVVGTFETGDFGGGNHGSVVSQAAKNGTAQQAAHSCQGMPGPSQR